MALTGRATTREGSLARRDEQETSSETVCTNAEDEIRMERFCARTVVGGLLFEARAELFGLSGIAAASTLPLKARSVGRRRCSNPGFVPCSAGVGFLRVPFNFSVQRRWLALLRRAPGVGRGARGGGGVVVFPRAAREMILRGVGETLQSKRKHRNSLSRQASRVAALGRRVGSSPLVIKH
ncbi:hypothetical protein HPB50_020220 [Hyalomma asiaticum]|uniref:Uncharacterized protein n=1 Tax=Hyalomma asiaticum TaxID=266040 RepID=A0ACB7T934_HYAAI|nr:hypothetical protein HPB50_020220 [Hyalomma asiaticum]